MRTIFRTNKEIYEFINLLQKQRKMTKLIKFLVVNYYNGNLSLNGEEDKTGRIKGYIEEVNPYVEQRISNLEHEIARIKSLIERVSADIDNRDSEYEVNVVEDCLDISTDRGRSTDNTIAIISDNIEDSLIINSGESALEGAVNTVNTVNTENTENTESTESKNNENKSELFDMFKEFLT